jgi:hypothetical protein
VAKLSKLKSKVVITTHVEANYASNDNDQANNTPRARSWRYLIGAWILQESKFRTPRQTQTPLQPYLEELGPWSLVGGCRDVDRKRNKSRLQNLCAQHFGASISPHSLFSSRIHAVWASPLHAHANIAEGPGSVALKLTEFLKL